MSRRRGLASALFAALLFVGAALAALAFPASAAGNLPLGSAPAQVPMDLVALPGKPAPDGYNPADPRFSTSQLCADLGGDITAQGGGEVCNGMDKNGTFCIVGSRDAFPCRGLYKHVINCNGGYNRPALNPFICARKCDEDAEKARGANCEIAVNPDSVVAPAMQTVSYDILYEFSGPAHTIVVLQSPRRHTLALDQSANPDGVSLSAVGENWEMEITRPLNATLNITLAGKIVCEQCYPDIVTIVARFRPSCLNLLAATANNVMRCVEILVQSGEEVDERDENGRTPLHLAAMQGATVLATILLENGADVNVKDDDGATPLHIAAATSAVEVVSILLENGADPNAMRFNGETPLHHAAGNNAVVLASLLLASGATVNVQNSAGETPLHEAAKNNALALASVLLENGATVHAQNFLEVTPLHEAVKANAVALASLLLENGATINAVDNDGSTPLDFSIRNQNSEMEALLKMRGGRCGTDCFPCATQTGKDQNCDSLHDAALANDVKCAQTYLAIGANPNRFVSRTVHSTRSIAPLHYAAENNSCQVAALLLEHGATINIRHRDNHGNYSPAPLHTAASYANLDVMTLFLERGSDVNIRTGGLQTPLHNAVSPPENPYSVDGTPTRNFMAVTLLLMHGANVNAKNRNGWTPLYFVADEYYGFAYASLFVQHGANVNAKNDDNDTPLHRAAWRGRVDTAALLLENSAEVNAVNDNGDTPRDRAISNGEGEMEALLHRYGGRCRSEC